MLNIKKVKPMFTTIVTTMDKYEQDELIGGIIDNTKQQGTLKEYQRVIAIGNAVRDIKVGDLVSINPSRFAVKKHKEGSLKDGIITDNPIVAFNFDTINIDGNTYLVLQDRDIEFIIEEFEEIPNETISVNNNVIN